MDNEAFEWISAFCYAKEVGIFEKVFSKEKKISEVSEKKKLVLSDDLVVILKANFNLLTNQEFC